MAAIPPQLVGESPEFHALLDWVSDIATIEKPVLVLGERGTGKELIASRIHFLSPRWEQTYMSVNCAAHDDVDFDDIIYGGDSVALLSAADGGTLFLDNINRLSLRAQERLLRVIEYGEFDAQDGRGDQSVDIRFIASMSLTPAEALERGQISPDLLDRLAFEVVHVPPLRVRTGDIAPLIIHFGRKMVSQIGAERFPSVTPEVMEQLMAHDWPGNVRELKNVIDRSTARAFLEDETLTQPLSRVILDPLQSPWAPAAPQSSKMQGEDGQSDPDVQVKVEQTKVEIKNFSDRVLTFERGLIDEAMTACDHHQGKAAEYLSLTYHQFRGLLRKHGLKK